MGTATIKAVELSPSGGRFNLKNYGILDFVAQAETSPKLDDPMLISGLKELLIRLKPSTKDVVASIASISTFATVIELPYLSEKDLGKAIPFEARKYIPIPLPEVVLDWSIINIKEFEKYQNSNLPAGGQYPNVEVFIAAVPKNETERYKVIFSSAGLNLKALELENIALTRSLVGEDAAPLAIVNLGGRSTSIVIIDKGFERVSRNYELGGFEITKTLSRVLGVGFDRAEELKKAEGIAGEKSDLANAILPLIDLIVFETKKTIANYEESRKVKITKVVLTGGQANLPGLKDYFTKKIGKEAMTGNPFQKVTYNKTLEPVIKDLGSSLSVAIGLAMRKV